MEYTAIELKDILKLHLDWLLDSSKGKRANLSWANLSGANLSGANLTGANLEKTTLPHFSILPEKGSFTCFKKLSNGAIAQLRIPKDALRTSSLVGRKCRVSKAKVVMIWKANGDKDTKGIYMNPTHSIKISYRVGGTVESEFDSDIRIECTKGIHVFLTKQEAIDYV